ncbi:hypothetical protein ABPG74_003586 [Tetrahymena malaccensis]
MLSSLNKLVRRFSSTNKQISITTPIFYVNSQPHIGHLYTLILSDAYHKWKLIDNYESYFQTGTDEHGQKIQNSAKQAQKDPQQFVDQVSQKFVDLASQYSISYDKFNRTSDVSHKEGAQHFWNVLEKKGFIDMKKYEGWYHTSDETFIGEKDLVKDSSGKFVTQSGQPVDWVSEETHIFVLDKIREQVIKYLENQKPVYPEHYNNSMIKQLEELKDISISRPKSRLTWGITVPSNEKYTIYVWLDALTNYLTGLGYPHNNINKMHLSNNFFHIMGKDILKFHSIFWPAFLLAAGYSTPEKILIHHHWIKDNQKMSKSLGNVVDPVELGNKYGIDSVRLYFLSEGPQDFDANFDEADLTKTYNLFIEGFINLMSRVFNKKIIKDGKITEISWVLNEQDLEYISKFTNLISKIQEHLDKCDFRRGYIAMSELWGMTNKLMTDHAPWQKDISESDKSKSSYLILESVRVLSIFLYPFIPQYIQNVYKLMNIKNDRINTNYLQFRIIDKNNLPKQSFGFEELTSEFLKIDIDNKKLIFKQKFDLQKKN